jgi:hypothetical protein
MDAETQARGKERSGDCTRERGGRFTRDNLAGLDPGGLCPFHHDVGLGRPMRSPNVFGFFGGSCVPSGTCGKILRPNVLLQEANIALKGPNVALKEHDVTFTTCFRV